MPEPEKAKKSSKRLPPPVFDSTSLVKRLGIAPVKEGKRKRKPKPPKKN